MIEKFIPLMTSEEIVDLVLYLNRDQEMLEIGGGRSTVFFSNIVKKLVTVENDREWAKKISEFEGLKNKDWQIHVIEPDWPQSHPFQPAANGQFDRYITFIENLEDNGFDIILIDGRDRVRAAKASIQKLKTGGILLIHDFWNRPKYHSIINIPELALVENDNSYGKNSNNTLAAFKKIKY